MTIIEQGNQANDPKPAPDFDWIEASMSGEGWVRRAKRPEDRHACAPPKVADGSHGDLWRCRCGTLWRVGINCNACDLLPRGQWGDCRQGSWHAWKYAWRPATWWQRMRYRRVARVED